jgi:predicted nucleic acid-binding protein
VTIPSLFLDANVLFSAARSGDGRAASLVRLAEAGRCELLTSPHALEEARRNLELKYPESAGLEPLMQSVRLVSESGGEAYEKGLSFGLPPKDAPILGAALQAGADVLVTGDSRHFGHLFGEEVSGIDVVTPARALDALLL